MLGVRHTGRVAWRRKHASRHYVGYVLVTDDASGSPATSTRPASTPCSRSRRDRDRGDSRRTQTPGEQIVGEPAVVIELTDNDPIYLRPITTGPLGLDDLARKLSFASTTLSQRLRRSGATAPGRGSPAARRAQSPSSPCSIA